MRRVPATVITGFLGAGKTSLVDLANGCLCCTAAQAAMMPARGALDA